jgi:LuxR family maltose regulon positive regulatory protein
MTVREHELTSPKHRRRPGTVTSSTAVDLPARHRPPPFTLLESKLTAPAKRAANVPRTALVNRLRSSRHADVIVVTAPPGYGKTTMLADWSRRDGRPFAWLAIDAPDDEPFRLVAYLTAALDRAVGVEHALDALAAGAQPAAIVALLTRVVGAVATGVVVLLDDVHLVEDPECSRLLTTFVDGLPSNAQVAFAGWTEPTLPIARFRAEGRLLELGADDLTMSDREARVLFHGAGVDLPDAEVTAINSRVEGWPAGLHLAAISLRHHADDARSVASLPEVVGFASDYFSNELLSRLPAHEVRFLTRASVLDRMCASLCNAVLETPDAAAELDRLESSNLFLVPLDHERRWYRFQSLFRDVLQQELERREPGLLPTLASRAGDWYAAHGDFETAIDYARVSEDRARVVELVSASGLPVYKRGRFAAVDRWLAELDDPQLLRDHPAVAVIGALTYALSGRAETAERWANATEGGRADDAAGDRKSWRAFMRSVVCQDGPDQMLVDAELALGTMARGSWRASALLALAEAEAMRGDARASDATLEDAAETATSCGAVAAASIALATRSLLAGARNDWTRAEDLAEEARSVIRDSQLESHATSALTFAASARAAVRNADWSRVRDDVEQAESLLPLLTHVVAPLAVRVRLEVARVHLAFGDGARAKALLDEIREIFVRHPKLGALHEEVTLFAGQLEGSRRPDGDWTATLTAAELRLLPFLTTHLSFREIAQRLFVSRNTVKTQAISIYRKLGVASRTEAIDRAVELGLLATPAPEEAA